MSTESKQPKDTTPTKSSIQAEEESGFFRPIAGSDKKFEVAPLTLNTIENYDKIRCRYKSVSEEERSKSINAHGFDEKLEQDLNFKEYHKQIAQVIFLKFTSEDAQQDLLPNVISRATTAFVNGE